MGGIVEIPEIINEVGFDFWWDVKKVWDLAYPSEIMKLEELEWQLQVPFWAYGDSWYNLKPIDVMKDKDKYKEEYKRTMDSDLSYPIDIMMNKVRWTILDGMHRLLKAEILGLTEVKVRKIPSSEIPNIESK